MVLFLIKVFFFFNIFISQMGSFDTLNLIGSSFLVRVNWTFYDSKKIWVLKRDCVRSLEHTIQHDPTYHLKLQMILIILNNGIVRLYDLDCNFDNLVCEFVTKLIYHCQTQIQVLSFVVPAHVRTWYERHKWGLEDIPHCGWWFKQVNNHLDFDWFQCAKIMKKTWLQACFNL